MNVLVACEFSGIVRSAFEKRGHYALSCDYTDTEIPGPHYTGDVRDILNDTKTVRAWDIMIAHPPCTYLAVSGARWFRDRMVQQREAIEFVRYLMYDTGIKKVCIENPVSVISTYIRKPDQIIQPYEYGHGATKRTCLWLKNLPPLEPTDIVQGRTPRVHHMGPSKDRSKNRSRTYTGIAEAMATQWG